MKNQTTFKDPRYTGKDKYFNLIGYLGLVGIKLNPKTKFVDKSCLVIINAERNMGKSYASWDYIENCLWLASNFEWKVAYCRTNREKLKKARESFNAHYFYNLKRYWMSETKIYKITIDANTGKEVWEKRKEIGSLVSVNNEENFKSGIFNDYHMIFYDEYNEDIEQPNLWENWLNLLKTIKRRTDPFFILMVGNKITPNSDFLVNLGIEIEEDELEDDAHQQIGEDIHFIDIARKTFAHLNTEQDIVNQIASYNNATNKYLNEGKYLVRPPQDVRIFAKRIAPTRQLKFYLALDEDKFEYGKFIDHKTGKESYYIHKIENEEDIDFSVKMIVLDKLADIRNHYGIKMIGDDDYLDFANHLRYTQKDGRLFYSSFACKMLMERFVIRTINLLE